MCPYLSNILQLSAVNACSKYCIIIPSSGKVSIASCFKWIEPKTDSKEEEEATSGARQPQVSSSWV